MARKEADKFLADRGIAEDFRKEFFQHLDADDDGAAKRLFLNNGLDIDLYIRAMNKWVARANKRQSTFDEELCRRLEDLDFRRWFLEESKKIRQGRR